MAGTPESPFTIAAVQASPVFLDRAATTAKACELIATAGRAGARLIAFPEAFIPAYPDWVWAVPASEGGLLADLYSQLLDQAVAVPSETTEALGRAAQQAGAYVVVGINERNVEASGGSLYNTLLYLGPDGQVLGTHRKLVPTAAERMVWAPGDGSTLAVHDTPLGRLGGLICWENYMPLARYTMYAQGVQLYVAATWDRGEPWLSTLRHVAKEGRMVVIGCCMALRTEQLPDGPLKERFYAGHGEWINAGDSAIVDPEGTIIAGPAHEREEILYATIDPRQLRGPKWMLDVAGHYARPDIFELVVHTEPRPPLTLRARPESYEREAWTMNARDILKYGQGTLLQAIDGIADADWDLPGACGVWSMKDIVAHLTSYERLLEDILGSLIDGGATPYLDRFKAGAAFNDAEVEARRGNSIQAVLDEFAAAHERSMALIARIPEERRRQPGTLPWYGDDYALDDVIVYMYYGHKREHSAQIAAFRDRLKAAPPVAAQATAAR